MTNTPLVVVSRNRKKVTVTPEGVARVRELAAGGHPLYGIAATLGTTRAALQGARKRQPELQAALDGGHAALEAELVHCLLEAARKGQYACAMFLLKTRCGYRETGPVDGGPEGVVVNISIPDPMSKAEFAKIIEGTATVVPAGEATDLPGPPKRVER